MSEPIYSKNSKKSKETDLISVSGNIISNINYRLVFFMALVYIVVMSDVFITNVLKNINGAVDTDCTTTKGTTIQIIVLLVCLVIFDLLIKYKWL